LEGDGICLLLSYWNGKAGGEDKHHSIVVFGLIYVGAKIHFFSRFAVLRLGDYLEERWYFWAGMALAAGGGVLLGLTTRRRGPPNEG
jgi:hypothetical protein